MYIARNPAKTRPLSPNVKRLMRLSRTAPRNDQVYTNTREFSEKDYYSCAKQGEIFMEAVSMGLPVDGFTPLYMTSQIAGVFDVFFSSSADSSLPEMLRLPALLESPELIVEALYWIDDIITHAAEDVNQSLVLAEAYAADRLKLPDTLAGLPDEPNRDPDDPAAWDAWYFDKSRSGGHPWEVCRGGNSTHVDLYVRNDREYVGWKLRTGEMSEEEAAAYPEGYYFQVAGNAWNRSVEAVNFYVALKKKKLPVVLSDAEEILARFKGTDYIGIVPHTVVPRYQSAANPDLKRGSVIMPGSLISDHSAWNTRFLSTIIRLVPGC